MRQMIKGGAVSLAALGLAVFLLAQPALADMEVTESSAPGVKAGETLPDDVQFDIPKGKSVRLLLKTNGTTKTLKGPYKGTVANYKEQRSWLDRLTGKGEDTDPPMGASRGYVAPPK